MWNAAINTLAPTLAQKTFWLGPEASNTAQRHDTVFYTVLYTTGFFFLLVMALMLTFIVLYRRKKDTPYAKGPTHNTPLEIVWTVVPLVVVGTFFVMGFRAFMQFDTLPANADIVDVKASQWVFNFSYANGGEGEKLFLRVDRPVILRLTSADVLHSLWIPAFRVQRNAVPNRTVELSFTPTRLGTYDVLCTQYCGNGHSQMATQAVVVDEATYSARLAELSNIFVDPATKQPRSYAAVGQKLYKSLGCANCHSVDGAQSTGPTWRGLYKKDQEFSVAPLGYTLKASDDDGKWDAYLRQHILAPGATVVRGYQSGVMPSYASQLSGTPYKERKLGAIIEYIKSLDNHGPGGGPKYYRPMPLPAATAPGTQPTAGKP